MKSVCIILQSHYETDIRVRRKAEALTAAGYKVDVLALRSSYSKSKNYVNDGVNIYTINLGRKRGSIFRYLYEYGVFFLWAFFKIIPMMRINRYDIIDVNNLPDFLVFAAAYGKWKGAKIVFDMHEITPEFYISKYKIKKDSILVRILKYIERISFNFADYVITINHPIEFLLIKRGLPASKSTIITNTVDEDFFTKNYCSSLNSQKKRTEKSFVMMYHGTLTHIYGLDIAIEAFKRVHESMAGAEFWILGDGPDRISLEVMTKNLNMESKVRFLGTVLPQEIPKWVMQCEIGILATRQDVFLDLSFSSKLSEYIIMKKAVICSSLKTIRYYFSKNALAYFIPNSVNDLSDKMITLYRDREHRKKLSENAIKELAPIRWKVMRKRYLTLMDDIISGQRAGKKRENTFT